ncbi:hypothetical protein GIB67_028030 [Kingdonia uniflora]|uniref:MULE transposase domain-containing protein n=1 Tax=Kingdonia uniflora TaxID=39325 RepID=A0A7J7NE16_9MAGN|nr:hypothetical protein GIB67_028030 [Kingdonia uniflora]
MAEKPKRLGSTYFPEENLDELPDYFENDTEEEGDFNAEEVDVEDTKEEGDSDVDGVGGRDTGVRDEIVEKNVDNLVDNQIDPNNLEAMEEYHSTHSSQDRDNIQNENDLSDVMIMETLQNDGHAMRLMNGVYVHNCKRKPGAKNRLANALWVVNEIEETIRDMKEFSPQDAMTIISRRYGVDLSYFTAWNAKTICMERIVGSFDKGYTLMPKLCRQILISNPSSIAKCKTDDVTKMWTRTCIEYKASLDGSECRATWKTFLGLIAPYLTLHPSKLTFISNRQKELVDVVAQIFHHQNHRFCFMYFYKNFKKNFRGTHLEKLSWGAAKAYVQEEKEKFLDKLDKDHPGVRQWLEKEPYEACCMSHFDFSAKCKHITNNFSESFNNWITKMRDIPIHKSIENLNLMMMKLTYERRLKAKKWDQDGIVPRVQVHIAKLDKEAKNYNIQRSTENNWVVINTSGHRWTLNLEKKQCSCNEWKV